MHWLFPFIADRLDAVQEHEAAQLSSVPIWLSPCRGDAPFNGLNTLLSQTQGAFKSVPAKQPVEITRSGNLRDEIEYGVVRVILLSPPDGGDPGSFKKIPRTETAANQGQSPEQLVRHAGARLVVPIHLEVGA